MADVLHFPAETTHFGTAFVTGLCSIIVQLRRVFIEVLPTEVLDMLIDLLGPVAERMGVEWKLGVGSWGSVRCRFTGLVVSFIVPTEDGILGGHWWYLSA